MYFRKAISGLLIATSIMTFLPAAYADIYSDNNISDAVKGKIENIVNAPSHLAGIDSFKRKSKKERIKDNIEWYKKHGKTNEYYNKFGLDIKNYRNADDFITEKELKKLAVHHGNVDPKNHIQLMKDKVLFEKIVKQHYPEVIPGTYFEFKGKRVIPTNNAMIKKFKNTESALDSLKDGKYFVKEVSGLCGNGAILITKQNGNLSFRHVNKGKISLSEFLKITDKTNFMLQEHVENHDDIRKLSPYALTTIRIVSTRFHDEPHILSADMRVSCRENSVVDNFHKGGAIVHVNTKTGKLAKYAHRRIGKSIKAHPISKIKFEGYQLPYWKETLDLVKKLHNIFPEFSSIGWDVAITPTGPKIIEGNHQWDLAVPQTTIGGIKERWEKLKKI